MNTAPITIRWTSSLTPSSCSPFSSTARSSTPHKVRLIDPRPPSRLLPPTTIAAIAVSASRPPAFGWPDWTREVRTRPPRPTQIPVMTKQSRTTRSTGIAERRDASRFPPTANTLTPNDVWVWTKKSAAKTPITSHRAQRIPRNPSFARFPSSVGTPDTTAPSVMARAMPWAMVSIPNVAMKDGTLSLVTIRPLIRPIPAPTPRQVSTPSRIEPVSRITVEATTLTSATPAPTERSSSPAKITKERPKATIASVAAWSRMLVTLSSVAKNSFAQER